MSLFRGVLNPAQVIDIGKKKPEAALEWCVLLKSIPSKILVAGGDGTIGWILNTILKLNLEVQPAVGILPLGKGANPKISVQILNLNFFYPYRYWKRHVKGFRLG